MRRRTIEDGENCLFAVLHTANKRGSNIPEATSKESVHDFVHALFCIRAPKSTETKLSTPKSTPRAAVPNLDPLRRPFIVFETTQRRSNIS